MYSLVRLANETRATSVSATSKRSQIETVKNRLKEAGVRADRFSVNQPGSKRPIDREWHPASVILRQNFFAYAVECGEGLVTVDIDPHEIDGVENLPDWIHELPSTFTVKTPHDGFHLYYIVDEDVTNTNRDETEGYSVRSSGYYVVGPGTELDGCDKEWHDCSDEHEGLYRIVRDKPLACVSAEVFPGSPTQTLSTPEPATDPSREPTETDTPQTAPPEGISVSSTGVESLEEIEAPFDRLDTRTEVFMDDEHRKALWEGRYRAAGFTERSGAETKLATNLYFFFPDFSVVSQLMDLACHDYPGTDFEATGDKARNLRKWRYRQDEIYRRSVLKLPVEKLTYFDTFDPDDYDGLPPAYTFDDMNDVGGPTREAVLRTVDEVGPTTPKEIADHPRVNVQEAQVRNALRELIDDIGLVESWPSEDDRRTKLYAIHGSKQ